MDGSGIAVDEPGATRWSCANESAGHRTERVVEPYQLDVEVGNGEPRIRSPECLISEAEKLTYCQAIEPGVCARHSR